MSQVPLLLIPVRSFETGKRRLSAELGPLARRALISALLDNLLRQAAVWPGLEHTVVLSPCAEVRAHARSAGARVLSQPPLDHLDEALSHTLNAALTLACAQLRRPEQGDLMIVASDLPCVTVDDLRDLAARSRSAAGHAKTVIATDLAGTGTNALFLPAGNTLAFRYGPDSAGRHVQSAIAAGQASVCATLAGLAFDLDTPDDIKAWRQLERSAA
jgi:2-phospho-L-lactate guanylyltransferase